MIIRSTWWPICATSIALCLTTVSARSDADDGEKLARRWCASCHLAAPDQRQASTDAPPFATIGRMPGFSREKLAYFLLAPHPKMPDMSLSRSEAADLADYIAKFGRTGP